MATVPKYFDSMLTGYRQGLVGRFVHLGHWDEPPVDVNDNTNEFQAAQDRLNQAVIDLAELQDGQAVLDVGCGFGGTLACINQRWHNMFLCGANIDSRQLDVCAEIVPQHHNWFEWHAADACALPFRDRYFDRIVCVEAMFHFASRQTFLAEAWRILKPHGILAVSDMTVTLPHESHAFPWFCANAIMQDGYGPWPDFGSHFGKNPQDYQPLACEVGLELTQIVDATVATRPSHLFTCGQAECPGAESWSATPDNPLARAALLLRWLHEHNYLRYWYLQFRKPA